MKFRTEIKLNSYPFQINHQTAVFMIGSCFTDNIGEKIEELLFPVKINPFGVVYNPLSVFRSLELIIEKKEYKSNDLFQYENKWHSWDHHSSFSSENAELTINKINTEINDAHDFLKKSKYLIITLGTARIYRLLETNKIVCNCHKVPADKFQRELLEADVILENFLKLKKKLHHFNPDIKIIFTISPVRHWKDGAFGNQLSKAVLHLAIYKLLSLNECEYFPAYEIMMDDLRDYRFYADDMFHPNKLAINYIWEKFSDGFFSDESQKLNKKISGLVKASGHRFFDNSSEDSLKFIKKTEEKILKLKETYSFINVDLLLKALRK